MPTKEELEALAAEEELEDEQETPSGDDDKEDKPAEAKKTEKTVPYDRFSEVNAKRKKAEKELAEYKAEQQRKAEERLEKQGEWEQIARTRGEELEAVKAKAAKAEEQEEIMQTLLDSQLEELPEDMRDIVPEDLTVPQKLKWLAKNKSRLLKPSMPDDLGGGNKGGGGDGEENTTVKLTAEEKRMASKLGMTEEEYGKYKDE